MSLFFVILLLSLWDIINMLNFDVLRVFVALLLVTVGVLVVLNVHRTKMNAITRAACTASSTASSAWTVDETACPVATACQTGVVKEVGGLNVCHSFDRPVGTACESSCYATGTTTTCDSEHQCSSTNHSACLGYCEITEPDWAIAQYAHPDCTGKLSFKPYFKWDFVEASLDYFNHLYYSDMLPYGDCFAEHGCRWYATVIRAYSDTDEWITTTGTVYDCLDFLDDTNPSGCIEAFAIEMGANQSDTFFRTVLDPHTAINLTQMHFQATACNYWYKCASSNQTYYSDPQYHWDGKKRAITDEPVNLAQRPREMAVQRFLDRLEAKAEHIGRELDKKFGTAP
jgi:hypothetical protein